MSDLSTLRAVAVGAFAAGVSAVLSLVAAAVVPGGSASLDPRNVGVVDPAHRR